MAEGGSVVRPRASTIRAVVAHLNELGLDVSGQMVDLDTGEERPSQRYYDADEIIKLRRLIETDATWYDDSRM